MRLIWIFCEQELEQITTNRYVREEKSTVIVYKLGSDDFSG